MMLSRDSHGRVKEWIQRWFLPVWIACATPGAGAVAADVSTTDGEFFENRIRPVLAEHCFECHSGTTTVLKGGLRLDTAAGVRTGGASGALLVAGNPEDSRIVQAIRGGHPEIKAMPPKGPRLAPAVIADIEEWIRRGAPDPRTESASAPVKNPRSHWAFKAPADVEPPKPHFPKIPVHNAIDLFVQDELFGKGIQPSPAANPHTLLRRASLITTGLLPTPGEMEAFLSDTSGDAYERAVDRLLSSPRYGERWGRHWLDVARYADSKGYVFEEERRYAYSHTYRDWVVSAFNRDLPYDQFLIQQIAGDRVATPGDPAPMAALGFLTLGRRFLNNVPDIIDDRIDVVSRGLMGLTVQCARCHDHKFDPIPTADYYSFYGIFNSTHEPGEKPLLAQNPNPLQKAAYESERTRRQKELDDFRAEKTAEVMKTLRQRVGDYLRTAHEGLSLDSTQTESLARSRKLDPGVVTAWQNRLQSWKTKPHSAFVPWFAFAGLGTNEFTFQAAQVVAKLNVPEPGTLAANPLVARSLAEKLPANFTEVIDQYGALLSEVDSVWQRELALAATNGTPAPAALAQPEKESLRQLLYAADSPLVEASGDINRFFDTPTAQKSRALKRKLDELDATHPGAPLRAMALLDNSKGEDSRVFKRGNPGNPGPVVPRRFLEILDSGTGNRESYTNGSGRLELAKAIASRKNPLTARVWVNRAWMWNFGSPLVRTPSDFGVRSDPPTHPALLDWLAVWFMNEGWSMKKLHRLMLTSHTFRQSSSPEASIAEAAEKLDLQNTLLWRMNRQRADLEALRDNLLAVGGNLDYSMGGQAVEVYSDKSQPRRSLYGFIDRQNLPGILRAFDFASPDSTSPMRYQTTVPQQALFFMNSPFVREQARHLAALTATEPSEKRRVEALFRATFQRRPTPDESSSGLGFVNAQLNAEPPPPPASASWALGWGSVETNSGTVVFHPFEHFKSNKNPKEGQWQIQSQYPLGDARGYLGLNVRGGHPGRTIAHAAIRRWTAPAAGSLEIRGKLNHPGEAGDGVRAQVVFSKAGSRGNWVVHNAKADTDITNQPVAKGEAVDFVVDCREDDNTDSFEWTVKLVWKPSGDGGEKTWDSVVDFSGPTTPLQPLNAWEKLAQALLAANEFVFVD